MGPLNSGRSHQAAARLAPRQPAIQVSSDRAEALADKLDITFDPPDARDCRRPRGSDGSTAALGARRPKPEVSCPAFLPRDTAPPSWKQQRGRGCVTWRLVLTSESHGRLLHCPRRSRSPQHGRADYSLSSGSGPPTWDSRGPPAARSSRGSASLGVQSASPRPSTSGRSRANSQGPCPARLPTLSMSTRRCRRRVGHDEDSLASGAPPLPPLSKCKPLFRRASAPQRSHGAGARHDPMPIFCTAASA